MLTSSLMAQHLWEQLQPMRAHHTALLCKLL